MYIYIKSSQHAFEISYNFICQLYLGKAVAKKDWIPWYGIGPVGRGSYRMTDFSSAECRIGWFLQYGFLCQEIFQQRLGNHWEKDVAEQSVMVWLDWVTFQFPVHRAEHIIGTQ